MLKHENWARSCCIENSDVRDLILQHSGGTTWKHSRRNIKKIYKKAREIQIKRIHQALPEPLL